MGSVTEYSLGNVIEDIWIHEVEWALLIQKH